MTWAPWSGHGVTMKHMVSRFMNIAHQKTPSFPRRRESIVFICPLAGVQWIPAVVGMTGVGGAREFYL